MGQSTQELLTLQELTQNTGLPEGTIDTFDSFFVVKQPILKSGPNYSTSLLDFFLSDQRLATLWQDIDRNSSFLLSPNTPFCRLNGGIMESARELFLSCQDLSHRISQSIILPYGLAFEGYTLSFSEQEVKGNRWLPHAGPKLIDGQPHVTIVLRNAKNQKQYRHNIRLTTIKL